METSRLRDAPGVRRLPDWVVVGAACVFVFLAAYQIKLAGLYYDELYFVNAAQGAPDNTFIHMRVGSLPLFLSPYFGHLPNNTSQESVLVAYDWPTNTFYRKQFTSLAKSSRLASSATGELALIHTTWLAAKSAEARASEPMGPSIEMKIENRYSATK